MIKVLSSKILKWKSSTNIKELFHISLNLTPRQGGVVDRKNRTLTEAGRTMLEEAKLPTYL